MFQPARRGGRIWNQNFSYWELKTKAGTSQCKCYVMAQLSGWVRTTPDLWGRPGDWWKLPRACVLILVKPSTYQHVFTLKTSIPFYYGLHQCWFNNWNNAKHLLLIRPVASTDGMDFVRCVFCNGDRSPEWLVEVCDLQFMAAPCVMWFTKPSGSLRSWSELLWRPLYVLKQMEEMQQLKKKTSSF